MATILSRLAQETGLPEFAIARLMRSAPIRYKRYTIPKRSGGLRLIAQPAREVKVLQKALVDVLLDGLPVHDAATAYRPGKSILSNAAPHSQGGPILKMDFTDFFSSIRASDWRRYCIDTGCLVDEDEIEITSSLLFHRQPHTRELRLAIGAPSSPAISNLLMFDFDSLVYHECKEQGVTYTRYADDLTFSAPRTGHLNAVRKIVYGALSDLSYPRITVNEQKTVLATKKYKRFVTGLVLANDGRITIGREKKRLISAKVHRFMLGKMSFLEVAQLSGHLAHINAVEPGFLVVLRKKYGDDTLARLTKEVPKQLLSARKEGRLAL